MLMSYINEMYVHIVYNCYCVFVSLHQFFSCGQYIGCNYL